MDRQGKYGNTNLKRKWETMKETRKVSGDIMESIWKITAKKQIESKTLDRTEAERIL